MLAKHEERNNLYAYVGQGDRFKPVISKKIKLENGDILALYTRGIWENLDSGELDENGSPRMKKVTKPFSMNNVTITLWGRPAEADNRSDEGGENDE